jgi:hypothetical protein
VWRIEVLAKVTPEVRELYVIAGRGSGKSRIAALLAACYAVREYRRVPGERIYVGIFGPDRRQARLTFSYIIGQLRAVPELAYMIQREVMESVDLVNGVTIEVMTASPISARSRSYALVVIEEAAFLPQEESAEPDVELVRALRPALARVQGSLLAVVSSPYARRGILWDAWQKREAGDPEVVLVQKSTRELNPTFDQRAIDKARADDPVAAATEYGAQFRSDVESYVLREAVEACVAVSVRELPPAGRMYQAFCDPSGGREDSMTLAIGREERGRVVVSVLLERLAPFSPEAVVRDFAGTLLRYGVTTVVGDRYGGEWPREMFRKHGIEYQPAESPKSDLYRDALPFLNSGRISLLDNRRLVEQLVGLERKVGRGGRDSIDHAPGGHDDLANAVAGLSSLVALTDHNPLEGRLVL